MHRSCRKDPTNPNNSPVRIFSLLTCNLLHKLYTLHFITPYNLRLDKLIPLKWKEDGNQCSFPSDTEYIHLPFSGISSLQSDSIHISILSTHNRCKFCNERSRNGPKIHEKAQSTQSMFTNANLCTPKQHFLNRGSSPSYNHFYNACIANLSHSHNPHNFLFLSCMNH